MIGNPIADFKILEVGNRGPPIRRANRNRFGNDHTTESSNQIGFFHWSLPILLRLSAQKSV